MTITVVTDLTQTPPTNTVTVSSGVGSVMSQVALYRNDPTGKVLVRTQPGPGFASRTVTDVECPYGVTDSYSWTATYAAPGTVLFDENWANTSAWTLTGCTATVSGGKATVTQTLTTGSIRRSFAEGKYRITVGGLTCTLGATASLQLVMTSSHGPIGHLTFSGPVPGLISGTTIDATQPFTIDIGATTFTVAGTGGSATFPLTDNGLLAQVSFTMVSPPISFVVGEVKVQAYGTTNTLSETSAPVLVAAADGWAIHPITPAKSVKLGFSGHRVSTIRNLGDITNPDNSTIHSILGSATPISTVTGPRGDDQLQIVISVTTALEEANIKAMLADQTPILFNLPAGKNVGLDYGFYAVGATTRSKLGQLPNFPFKSYVLPLTKVQSPIASVVNTGWSWAQLLLAFPDWNTIKLAYNTWADVFANNRNPGF